MIIPVSVASNTTTSEELSLNDLLAEVQARNPSLQAMVATWHAASLQYPQVVSLEDPMFMGMIAPQSVNSSDVETGYALQAGQKFPWYGKRAARGCKAQAEADAAYHDVGEYRLKLIEMTRMAYLDYYLVRQRLSLNAENLRVMKQFRQVAETKYQNNQVTQQDLLQADIELVNLEQRQIELQRLDHLAQPIDHLALAVNEATLSRSDLNGMRIQLVAASMAAGLVLVFATMLSVYKPLGMTRYGRRIECEQTGSGVEPNRRTAINTPGWVKLLGFIAIGLILVFLILHLAGGGLGRHAQ